MHRGDNAQKAARPREPPEPGAGAGGRRGGCRAAFAAPHWYAGGGCAAGQTEKVSPGDGGKTALYQPGGKSGK